MSRQYATHPSTTQQGGSYSLAQPLSQQQHQQHFLSAATSSQDGVSVTANSRVSPWSAQVPLQRPRSMSDRQEAAAWNASTTQAHMQQSIPASAAAQHAHGFVTNPAAQATPSSGLDVASTVPGSDRPSQTHLYQAYMSQVPSTTWSSQGVTPFVPLIGTDSTYPSLVPATMSAYPQDYPAYAPPFTASSVSEVSLSPATVVPPTYFNYAPAPAPTATTPAAPAAPSALAAASGMPMPFPGPVPSVLAQSAPASINPAQGSSRHSFRAVPAAPPASQARPCSSAGPNRSNKQFKCDICPQAFNRNHDLKRHKVSSHSLLSTGEQPT